jgi:hypothetical protein
MKNIPTNASVGEAIKDHSDINIWGNIQVN